MALLWIEGFDEILTGSGGLPDPGEYLTALGWGSNGTWGQGLPTASTRYGYGYGWNFYGSGVPIRAWKFLPVNVSEGIVGLAFNARSNNIGNGGRVVLSYAAGGNSYFEQAYVEFSETTVTLAYAYNTSTLQWQTVSTSTLRFLLDTWNYAEIAFKTDPSAGYVHVRINGAPIASIDGVRTVSNRVGAPSYMNEIMFESINQSEFWVDDVYLCDTTGTVNNAYLGECRVRTLTPDSAGDLTAWAPTGAATNWQAADNYDPATTTIYNSTTTVGATDLYNLSPLVNGLTIYGVQVRGQYLHDDAGTHTVQNAIKTHGTEYDGAIIYTAPSSYTASYDVYEVNPNTGSGWTQTEVNALQIGPKMVS